ncbi:hypothetical protein AMS68_005616 [Peltaster fructicola]|uniref:Uncharacterized protein n=1 Tax=Peltaster fructicola TaxID=286661 RepID=A0A6H0XZQ4_9PEZI|nr:hypothetical protein AMS68_005616 [Peltaster fructicola]
MATERPGGIGSLVVIASIEETYSSQGYAPDRNDYPDRLLGNWEYRPDNVRDSGIPPTHCLGVTNVNRSVIPQKCNKFFTTFEGLRYGSRPVAKFVFYYRGKAAIYNANCMPCPNKAYPVQEEHEEEAPIESEELESPASAEDDASMTLFMASAEDQPAQPKRKKLGGTLTLPKAYHTIEQKPKSFQQLVTQSGRSHDNRTSPVFWARERSSTTKHGDSIGAAVAASRTVYIAGKKYVMLSIRSIDDLMLKEGVPLVQLLNYVFQDLPKEDRSEAAKVLIQHMTGFAVVLQTKDRRLVCVRLADLPKGVVAKRQLKRQGSPGSPKSSEKRLHTRTGPQPVQQTKSDQSRNKIKHKAMERLQQLREAQRQLAEEEAAAVAELENAGRGEVEEVMGHMNMQEASYHEHTRESAERVNSIEDAEHEQSQEDDNSRNYNLQAVGYYQSPSPEDEAAEYESESAPHDSDGSSYKP